MQSSKRRDETLRQEEQQVNLEGRRIQLIRTTTPTLARAREFVLEQPDRNIQHIIQCLSHSYIGKYKSLDIQTMSFKDATQHERLFRAHPPRLSQLIAHVSDSI
jgi:hypothetical protein